jgi:hypothetical protein
MGTAIFNRDEGDAGDKTKTPTESGSRFKVQGF